MQACARARRKRSPEISVDLGNGNSDMDRPVLKPIQARILKFVDHYRIYYQVRNVRPTRGYDGGGYPLLPIDHRIWLRPGDGSTVVGGNFTPFMWI